MFQFRAYTADELSKMSDYERERIKNIEEMRREMDLPLVEAQQSAAELAKRDSPVKKKPRNRTRHVTTAKEPKFVRRSSRIILGERKVTSYNEESDDETKNNIGKRLKRGSLKVRFHWATNNKYQNTDKLYYSTLNDDDFIDDDEDYEYETSAPGAKRKRSDSYDNAARLAPSAVTQQMLDNITYSSSNKKYSENGTTCHQCRQKTTDQKSFCRVKTCRGKRGNFCGFCLGGRYNEDVAKVLLNPKWACPPCRGYCNCSICRRRKGMIPTGQLVQKANAEGFDSVRDMLNSIEGENNIDVLEFDDNNEDDSYGGDDNNEDDSYGGDDNNEDDSYGGDDNNEDDSNKGNDIEDDSNKEKGKGNKNDGMMMNEENENDEQGTLVSNHKDISADGSPEFNQHMSDDGFSDSNGPFNSGASWCTDSVSSYSSDSVSDGYDRLNIITDKDSDEMKIDKLYRQLFLHK